MRQAALYTVAAVLLFVVIGATPVSADPVTITGGQAVANLSSGSFSFTGAGLSASAGLPDGWSTTVAIDCSPCSSSEPVTLSFSSTCVSCTSEGSTGNMLGGTVYPAPTTFFVNFNFEGPTFSSSEITPDHLSFSAPFSMTGTLQAHTSFNDPNPPFFSTDLMGNGTATITFVANPTAGLYTAENITYDFSAGAGSQTPEPASLVLLGSGAAFLWRKR